MLNEVSEGQAKSSRCKCVPLHFTTLNPAMVCELKKEVKGKRVVHEVVWVRQRLQMRACGGKG